MQSNTLQKLIDGLMILLSLEVFQQSICETLLIFGVDQGIFRFRYCFSFVAFQLDNKLKSAPYNLSNPIRSHKAVFINLIV